MAGKVRIRMYSIGFGDCFLLTFPGDQHMLIDCGVHAHSKVKRVEEVVAKIVEDTDRKLAVVVVTHAHADHISGFSTCKTEFEKFEVGEVWLPWLEDVSKPSVKKLHKKVAAVAAAALTHFKAKADDMVEALLVNAFGEGLAAAEPPNTVAMKLLRGGFGDKNHVHYLAAGDEFKNAGGIKGLTVRVLAPTKDQQKWGMGSMEPPDAQQYKLVEVDGVNTVQGMDPFPKDWWCKAPKLELTGEEEAAVRDAVAVDPAALALFVDGYLNNTSLALLLTYEGKTLLFPGDAQWGNWRSWQDDWDAILGDISFYKVGHHGSHNATPSGAMDKMTNKEKLLAMVSTDFVDEFRNAKHPVPFKKLLTRLGEVTDERFARSDQLKKAPAPFEAGDFWCDVEV